MTIWFDSMYNDFDTSEGELNERYSYFKIIKNQISQITIDFSVLVSLNFIILHVFIFKLEVTSHHIHENFNTLIIIFISCSVSDIETRINDVLPALALLWLFLVHHFIAHLTGENLYPFVAGSNGKRQEIFIVVIALLLSVEIALIHFVTFFISVLKKEISETENLSRISAITA